MAGAKLGIEVDDRDVAAAFDRLLEAGADLEPAFRDIGEMLLISHRERFRTQESPEGAPWTPLSPKYQARKKRNRNKDPGVRRLAVRAYELCRRPGPAGVRHAHDLRRHSPVRRPCPEHPRAPVLGHQRGDRDGFSTSCGTI